MKTSGWRTKVLPGLLAGTERMPLPVDDVTTLAALSLTGQSLRFTRPASPAHFVAETHVVDERRLLPDALRKPLIWLLRGRRLTEDVELTLAWNFARLKLRPHPFDLPRMAGFTKAHAEALGATARHWARRDEDGTEPLLDQDDVLDETNWEQATPALRVRFVAERRRNNPAAGLELVRSVWTREDANLRLRLLEAMQPELHEGDREFIAGLDKDRGTQVRALAQRMMYRLNGFTGEHPALRECLSRITRKTEGLLRKRVSLSLEVPATIKDHTLKGWIRETFAEVRIDELSRGLDLSEHEMVETSTKDANLLLALALTASESRRFDLLDEVVKRLPEAWELMTQCGPMHLERMPQDDRIRWGHCLARPYGGEPPFSFGAWSWMHRALLGPLPAECLEGASRSRTWRQKLQEAKGPEWPELLAACCPADSREKLRVLLSEMEPTLVTTALALLDILDAMEKG